MTRFEIAVEKQAFDTLNSKPMVCMMCGTIEDVMVRHRYTQYNEDHLNYMIACGPCMKLDDEYNKKRWEEYYSSIIC